MLFESEEDGINQGDDLPSVLKVPAKAGKHVAAAIDIERSKYGSHVRLLHSCLATSSVVLGRRDLWDSIERLGEETS